MDHPQTPRILAPHLSNFQHRIVRVLGKVVQLRGDSAVIDAGGQIDVLLNRVRRVTPHGCTSWGR
jgi:replication factor A3